MEVAPNRGEEAFVYLKMIMEMGENGEETGRSMAVQMYEAKPFVFTGLKRDTDLLTSPKTLPLLLFSETIDLLLRHPPLLPFAYPFLQSFSSRHSFISLLEPTLLEKSQSEQTDYSDLMDLTGISGWSAVYSSDVTDQETALLSHKAFIASKDSIITAGLKALKSALAETPERLMSVLQSQDWRLYVNPYMMARSGRGVSVVERKLMGTEVARKSGYRESADGLNRLVKIKGKIERFITSHRSLLSYTHQESKHHSSYCSSVFRRYYKHQTTLGLWSLPSPPSLVLKIDPEFDLELKSVRLKTVRNRPREYYMQKAHHRTLQAISREEEVQRPRRSMFAGRRSESVGRKDFSAMEAHTQLLTLF